MSDRGFVLLFGRSGRFSVDFEKHLVSVHIKAYNVAEGE